MMHSDAIKTIRTMLGIKHRVRPCATDNIEPCSEPSLDTSLSRKQEFGVWGAEPKLRQ